MSPTRYFSPQSNQGILHSVVSSARMKLVPSRQILRARFEGVRLRLECAFVRRIWNTEATEAQAARSVNYCYRSLLTELNLVPRHCDGSKRQLRRRTHGPCRLIAVARHWLRNTGCLKWSREHSRKESTFEYTQSNKTSETFSNVSAFSKKYFQQKFYGSKRERDIYKTRYRFFMSFSSWRYIVSSIWRLNVSNGDLRDILYFVKIKWNMKYRKLLIFFMTLLWRFNMQNDEGNIIT